MAGTSTVTFLLHQYKTSYRLSRSQYPGETVFPKLRFSPRPRPTFRPQCPEWEEQELCYQTPYSLKMERFESLKKFQCYWTLCRMSGCQPCFFAPKRVDEILIQRLGLSAKFGGKCRRATCFGVWSSKSMDQSHSEPEDLIYISHPFLQKQYFNYAQCTNESEPRLT